MDYVERVSTAGHGSRDGAMCNTAQRQADRARRWRRTSHAVHGLVGTEGCPKTRVRGSMRHSGGGQCVLSPVGFFAKWGIQVQRDDARLRAAIVHYNANDEIWMDYKVMKGRESVHPRSDGGVNSGGSSQT